MASTPAGVATNFTSLDHMAQTAPENLAAPEAGPLVIVLVVAVSPR